MSVVPSHHESAPARASAEAPTGAPAEAPAEAPVGLPRRVAAIVLPRLATELVPKRSSPLAVVLSDTSMGDGSAAALVGAVDDAAAALGARPGMRVSEAMARSAEITFATLSARALVSALGAVAEVAFSFGAVVEIGATPIAMLDIARLGTATLDTVWVDVTGVAHLFGGEASLRDEIESRVAALGHRVDVAIADGPFFAQALARFAGMHADVPRIAPIGEGKRCIERLPVAALGLGVGGVSFFARIGVLSLGDLMRIDRKQLASRLGSFVAPPHDLKEVLGWLDGKDPRPLVPYEPPAVLVEAAAFEDGVETASRLVFAVRGLVSRLSARLMGRRQATNRIEILLHYDRSIHALTYPSSPGFALVLGIDLPAPLSHTDDVFRAIKAKVEGIELASPVVRLEIHLVRIVRAPEVQLDLSREVSVSPDALPALLSEISAEIGADRVGVLSCVDDHRPERRSALIGIHEAARERPTQAQLALFGPEKMEAPEPTRILKEPIALGCTAEGGRRIPAFQPGQTLFVGKEAFVVRSIRFDRRLEAIAWWTAKATSRDYLRVKMTHGAQRESESEAWIFVDRKTGGVFLHGWWE